MKQNYDQEITWKQKFADDIERFREKAYENDNLMPKRYCFVLTQSLQLIL